MLDYQDQPQQTADYPLFLSAATFFVILLEHKYKDMCKHTQSLSQVRLNPR